MKIALLVDAEAEKDVADRLAKKSAAMKSWLLTHLASKSFKNVDGEPGKTRTRQEVLEKFRELLGEKNEVPLRDIEFVEFVTQ